MFPVAYKIAGNVIEKRIYKFVLYFFIYKKKRYHSYEICDTCHYKQIGEKSQKIHYSASFSSTGKSIAPAAEAATAHNIIENPDDMTENIGM